MPNILNKPSEETHVRIAEALEKMAIGMIEADSTGSPGSKFIVQGNRDAGFLGFVPAANIFTGTELATLCGITAGTAINTDVAWIKYIYKGKIRFTPLRTLRHSITWDAIYNAACVHGNGTIGTLPPAGRMGTGLTIDGADNSINTTTQHFLSGTDSSDTVAAVGDSITLAGLTNAANNGTATVVSITNTKIVVSGKTLVTETGKATGKIYKTSNGVVQNKVISKSGINFKVMLMEGFENDPLASAAADRDAIGSEWNKIILPLHEKAKLQNWSYPAYAGQTEYWGTNLSDFDLMTLYTLGSGSYSWTKEVQDATSWRRGIRGYLGASGAFWNHSWVVSSSFGWRPVLEVL
jgi:hypothetical protein